jgi:hypothetical protein
MSGYAAFLETMEDIAKKVMSAVSGHVDARLDRLEERVTALEDRVSPAEAKARPAAKARAQTAAAKGTAGKESAG